MVRAMVPLAVSGTIIVAAAVSVAGVLIYVLLRGEERFDQQERRAQEQQAAAQEQPAETVSQSQQAPVQAPQEPDAPSAP